MFLNSVCNDLFIGKSWLFIGQCRLPEPWREGWVNHCFVVADGPWFVSVPIWARPSWWMFLESHLVAEARAHNISQTARVTAECWCLVWSGNAIQMICEVQLSTHCAWYGWQWGNAPHWLWIRFVVFSCTFNSCILFTWCQWGLWPRLFAWSEYCHNVH